MIFPEKKSTDQTKSLPGGGVTTLGGGTANYFIFRLWNAVPARSD